jgi:hypothetical protein
MRCESKKTSAFPATLLRLSCQYFSNCSGVTLQRRLSFLLPQLGQALVFVFRRLRCEQAQSTAVSSRELKLGSILVTPPSNTYQYH